MRSYIAVVFDDKGKAYKGLHALWELDDEGLVTVHGTTVVHRDERGAYTVDTKETHPALATAVGVGVGALLGAFAGPAGSAAGVAAGAALGATTGGVVGLARDLVRADNRDQVAAAARLVVGYRQSALIADVSEDSTSPVDARMHSLGGTIHRREKRTVDDDASFDTRYPFDDYLYPYEHVPLESPH